LIDGYGMKEPRLASVDLGSRTVKAGLIELIPYFDR
jgi:hypothetical protein